MNTNKKNTNSDLTLQNKTINLTPSTQKRVANGLDKPSIQGASAPLGIALFLCQKSIIMMGVYWETSVCRFLLLGLSTRFTPIAQCLITLCGGLQLARGSFHEYPIQHPSRIQPSATPQTRPALFAVAHHALQANFAHLAPASTFNAGGVA